MAKASGSTAAGKMSAAMAEQIGGMAGPSRKLIFGQLTQALKTGNIKARTPIIQTAVEQGLQQGSKAQQITTEQIAKAGGSVARSPFAKETLASQRALTERSISAIPSSMIESTVLGGGSMVNQANQLASQLLGTASSAQASVQQSEAAAQATNTAAAGAAVAIIAAI